MPETRVLLKGGQVYTGDGVLESTSVLVRGGRIERVGRGLRSSGAQVIDVTGLKVTPGLIDLHFQGVMGHDVWEATPAAFHILSAELAKFGVTGFLLTTAYYRADRMERQVSLLEDEGLYAGAKPLGLYLESPFVSMEKRGGIPKGALRKPSVKELGGIIEAARGKLRMMTVAAELGGIEEIIGELGKNGVIASIGHTNATYEETARAIEAGARHATHLLNAMSAIHHREPGAAVAVLLDERVTVEQIPDGIHIHPAMLEMVVRLKGADRVAIVTDAIKAAGLADGDYVFGDSTRKVRVKDGAPRLEDGRLAGSSLTLNRGVRNMVELVGRNSAEAVRMATLTPARVLGLEGRKGRIARGYDADIAVFDGEWSARATMISGKIVFDNIQDNG